MNLTASPTFNIRLLLTKYLQRVRYSRYATKRSDEIRQDFLNFFINKHDHVYVRSSPVIPFCDPTVAFVNAGMNQVRFYYIEMTPIQCIIDLYKYYLKYSFIFSV